MGLKKWISRTTLLAIVASSLCFFSRPASAGTTSAPTFRLTCRQAQAAVSFLKQLEEEVAEWHAGGYITADQEEDLLAYLDSQIARVEAAAPSCTF